MTLQPKIPSVEVLRKEIAPQTWISVNILTFSLSSFSSSSRRESCCWRVQRMPLKTTLDQSVFLCSKHQVKLFLICSCVNMGLVWGNHLIQLMDFRYLPTVHRDTRGLPRAAAATATCSHYQNGCSDTNTKMRCLSRVWSSSGLPHPCLRSIPSPFLGDFLPLI